MLDSVELLIILVKTYIWVKDHTIHAKIDGVVKFEKKKDNKSFVSVVPFEA
ncbi:hypothetical protein CCAN12_550016 [Capnocytophaga canimorsus]|uniref:Uncharacterized protein n=1 Tax=Capnocytophaga canimorsus TaxID=28188 RepID=A0A0B7H5S1_9FLAO|nr:hypothetical protein CCAN12_550016 [Capnocytophaga canimorsus]